MIIDNEAGNESGVRTVTENITTSCFHVTKVHCCTKRLGNRDALGDKSEAVIIESS